MILVLLIRKLGRAPAPCTRVSAMTLASVVLPYLPCSEEVIPSERSVFVFVTLSLHIEEFLML